MILNMPKFGLALMALAVTVTVAGCNTTPVREDEYNDPRYSGPGQKTSMNDQGIVLFGNKDKGDQQGQGGGGIGVNAYLWRASLDTLSFMPLASADPFGGVIITDWYQPPSSPGERFKATAYILGRSLRTDALRLSVFRQVQQGGTWVDAPVADTTVSEMENKVLARARELRSMGAAAPAP
jgi:hypothetical protein